MKIFFAIILFSTSALADEEPPPGEIITCEVSAYSNYEVCVKSLSKGEADPQICNEDWIGLCKTCYETVWRTKVKKCASVFGDSQFGSMCFNFEVGFYSGEKSNEEMHQRCLF